MTSNNLISGYQAVQAFREFNSTHWVRRLTFVEYGRRRGIYNHANGQITGRMSIDYVATAYLLSAKLHIGETLDWSGFPVSHEVKHFNLQCWDDYRLEFETVASGTIGILRGFDRDGYPVDIFAHARS